MGDQYDAGGDEGGIGTRDKGQGTSSSGSGSGSGSSRGRGRGMLSGVEAYQKQRQKISKRLSIEQEKN